MRIAFFPYICCLMKTSLSSFRHYTSRYAMVMVVFFSLFLVYQLGASGFSLNSIGQSEFVYSDEDIEQSPTRHLDELRTNSTTPTFAKLLFCVDSVVSSIYQISICSERIGSLSLFSLSPRNSILLFGALRI